MAEEPTQWHVTGPFFDFARQHTEFWIAPEGGSRRYIPREPAGNDVPCQLSNPSVNFRELGDRVLVVVSNEGPQGVFAVDHLLGPVACVAQFEGLKDLLGRYFPGGKGSDKRCKP